MYVKKDLIKKMNEFRDYLMEQLEEIDGITDDLVSDIEYAEEHGHKRDAKRMRADGEKICNQGVAIGLLGIMLTKTINVLENEK